MSNLERSEDEQLACKDVLDLLRAVSQPTDYSVNLPDAIVEDLFNLYTEE